MASSRYVTNLGTALCWLSCAACGYEALYAGTRPETRLSVTAAPYGGPHMEAVQAAVSGVRRSLSASGVLRSGDGYPRVVVEVVRVDERASGLRAVPNPEGELNPSARGSLVAVVGRAWVEDARGARASRDTGEVRRTEHYASASSPAEEPARYDAALQAAGHSLGQALGRRILGEPEATFEPM